MLMFLALALRQSQRSKRQHSNRFTVANLPLVTNSVDKPKIGLHIKTSSLPNTLPQVSTASEPGPECERVTVLSVHTSSASGVPSTGW